jgi:hypothetical protein
VVTTVEYQRITYEQLAEAQARQDESAHQFLSWASRLRGQTGCYHLLMQAYTNLFDEQSTEQHGLATVELAQQAALPISIARLARQASGKNLAVFYELEAFLLAKKLEAQVLLGHSPAQVEVTWMEWGELITHCEESPELRRITATILRNMALCYGLHLQPHLANTHYEALMSLATSHDTEPMLLQEWSKAALELSELYAAQKDSRRCRQLLDDLMDMTSHCEAHPWLRQNLVRTARNVVWSYRDQGQSERPDAIAGQMAALCQQFPKDKAMHRDMARLWVSLTYGYGQRRQWAQCLPMLKTLNDWMHRWPTDRHLRLRWMQVARNLVWGHDGELEGLATVEAVFNNMVALQQRYPQQAALWVELGWSCVNMSWSYGCQPTPPASKRSQHKDPTRSVSPVERVVNITRQLHAHHGSDVELAECFAATCRNWLWSLRNQPSSQSLQAKVAEELRQIMARFPKEPYIRKQTVACLVNYSYVAKKRLDASVLMQDLDTVQRLWMEHGSEDYLPQALSELASNLLETYEQAHSADEAKVYLSLIAGLATDKPDDPVILSSLGCGASETAWLCERLGDVAGTEHCHRLMETTTDRYPTNPELQKAFVSCTLAWLSALCHSGQLEQAFEVHLRIRYLAKRNLDNEFFQFCWGRSCELLIVSHPHHQPGGPLLPLIVAELEQIKTTMDNDLTLCEFWANSRLHLVWRTLAQGDMDSAQEEITRLTVRLNEHPQAKDLMPYQQKLLLASAWMAAGQQQWPELKATVRTMMHQFRRYPHWIDMAQTLAQAGVMAMQAYGQAGETLAANELLSRLHHLFQHSKQVYASVEDTVEVWDQFARVALAWQVFIAPATPTHWWRKLEHEGLVQTLQQASTSAESQCVLWAWIHWQPGHPLPVHQRRSDRPAPLIDPTSSRPNLVAASPIDVGQRIGQLLEALSQQHPHDKTLASIYRDWLMLAYVSQLSQAQGPHLATQTWARLRRLAAQPPAFRLKAS